nr:glycosyl hydrolase [Candidatus Sigynarchaeota archaeon]
INTTLRKKFGPNLGRSFGAFFCDSWEVYGEDWTRNFLTSFQEATGYDLKPFLPVLKTSLVQDYERTTLDDMILYDYTRHHADLILQEFFARFAEHCHAVGVKCRVQPYSAPTDLLRAYGLLDILEIEGFGQHGIGTMYYGNVDPRLASSGAHVYAKDLVSCESFTWLREHFCATLEDLKHEADQIIFHGVNRVIYHGYPYSPPTAGKPGWVFYASVMANHNNTWWPYIDLLNACITRNSMLSLVGRHVARFAVYIPYYDEWSGNKGVIKDLRIALKSNGHVSDYDYVNDERIINGAHVIGDQLEIGHGRYRALVLYQTEYMPVDTARRVVSFIEQGIPVLAVGTCPSRAPGYAAWKEGNSSQPRTIFSAVYNRIIHVESMGGLNEALERKGITPSLKVEYEDPEVASIQYLHRELNGSHFFFVINNSTRFINARLCFKASGSVERWDPEIGDAVKLRGAFKDDYTSIESRRFTPHEASWFIVHDAAGRMLPEPQRFTSENHVIKRIQGPWKVSHVWEQNAFPEEKARVVVKIIATLCDWTHDPEMKYFSGSATYETEFTIENLTIDEGTAWFLSLGEVHEIAEVIVNGREAGVSWHDERIINVTAMIIEGKNDLKIEVTNLLLNRIIGLDTNKVRWRPDYYFVNKEYKP